MDDIHKKRLRQLIDTYGLIETSELIGLSLLKLSQISEYPLSDVDYGVISELIFELYRTGLLKKNYKDYYIGIELDMSGEYIYWETGRFFEKDGDTYREDISVYATPFWDGEDQIPIDLLNYKLVWDDDMADYPGHSQSIIKVDTKFRDIEHLIDWFHFWYLPNVHDRIEEMVKEIRDKII